MISEVCRRFFHFRLFCCADQHKPDMCDGSGASACGLGLLWISSAHFAGRWRFDVYQIYYHKICLASFLRPEKDVHLKGMRCTEGAFRECGKMKTAVACVPELLEIQEEEPH